MTHAKEQTLPTGVPAVHLQGGARARAALAVRLRRIAVPLDGSVFARAALPPAMQLAATLGGELVLVQAVAPARIPGLDDEGLAYQLGETDAYRSLASAAAEAKQRGLAVADVLVKGDLATRPAHAILAAAGEFDCGLIAMATHGRTGIRRAVLGSVADEVVARAHLPVLLVHPHARRTNDGGGSAPDPARVPAVLRLVVALDGSPEAEDAFDTAIALTQPVGGEIDLVRVVEDATHTASAGRGAPGPAALAAEHAERYLSAAAGRLRHAWLPAGAIRCAVRSVRPVAGAGVAGIADALLQYAREQDATMLVIATHARRGVARLVRGSVAAAVIAEADLPVLVVRAPQA